MFELDCMIYKQCLFCLMRQKHCKSYFFIGRTQVLSWSGHATSLEGMTCLFDHDTYNGLVRWKSVVMISVLARSC